MNSAKIFYANRENNEWCLYFILIYLWRKLQNMICKCQELKYFQWFLINKIILLQWKWCIIILLFWQYEVVQDLVCCFCYQCLPNWNLKYNLKWIIRCNFREKRMYFLICMLVSNFNVRPLVWVLIPRDKPGKHKIIIFSLLSLS